MFCTETKVGALFAQHDFKPTWSDGEGHCYGNETRDAVGDNNVGQGHSADLAIASGIQRSGAWRKYRQKIQRLCLCPSAISISLPSLVAHILITNQVGNDDLFVFIPSVQ